MKACEQCSTYVSCDVFLVRGSCACVLVDGVGSPLSGGPCSVNAILAGESTFGCRLFTFINFEYIMPLLLPCRISVEKSPANLGEFLVCYLLPFPCCFKYFFFVINFSQFD